MQHHRPAQDGFVAEDLSRARVSHALWPFAPTMLLTLRLLVRHVVHRLVRLLPRLRRPPLSLVGRSPRPLRRRLGLGQRGRHRLQPLPRRLQVAPAPPSAKATPQRPRNERGQVQGRNTSLKSPSRLT